MTTDNKTLAVDVLAEMEQAHATLKGLAYASELTGDHIQADAMLEARAAVAELIEEATTVCQQPDPLDRHVRLRVTLARVKGASA